MSLYLPRGQKNAPADSIQMPPPQLRQVPAEPIPAVLTGEPVLIVEDEREIADLLVAYPGATRL